MASDDENLESFCLLWLDATVNTSMENIKAQESLRLSVNYIRVFENVGVCERFIRHAKNDQLILIISGHLGQHFVQHVNSLEQISSIYVYCRDQEKHQQWANMYSKVKAVTTDLDDLIWKIKSDQKTRNKIEEPLCIDFFKSSASQPDQSSTGLNGAFLHSQLLIDILVRFKNSPSDEEEFITICKKQYSGNNKELSLVKEFEEQYTPEHALYWYSRDSFLYKIVNKALRVQNVELLFLSRFFIRAVYNQLQDLQRVQSSLPVCVYRGQMMSDNELETLRQSIGQFISMNSFFSTSTIKEKAIAFFNNSLPKSNDLRSVLFEINADPRKTSYFSTDQYEKAMSILRKIYGENHEHIGMCLNNIGIIFKEQTRYREALDYFKRSLVMWEHVLPSGHDNLAWSHNNIGEVHALLHHYDLALDEYLFSLSIYAKSLPPDHAWIGEIYVNIGDLYKSGGDMREALIHLRKALAIFLISLPSSHTNIIQVQEKIAEAEQL